ncbi:MAG: hypothetical protein ACI8P9_004160 [Parasphingorhabdus sp.]
MAGFSLHAGVAVRANERKKLERLCRYINQPEVSEKRLSLTSGGNIRYQLNTPLSKLHHTCDFYSGLPALHPIKTNLSKLLYDNTKYESISVNYLREP